ALPVFGLLHVIYVDYVASVIPGWLPGHVFWAYATGAAHAAGGLALATGVRARLAAVLLAVMFGTWVVILHLPRALAAAEPRAEWSSLFVALAMCAGSMLLIDDRRRAT
ncbi:MAG: DoxX family membrane protein, partial [Kofleriaceae bacterium]